MADDPVLLVGAELGDLRQRYSRYCQTPCGRMRRVTELSNIEIGYLVVAAISVLVSIGFTGKVLDDVPNQSEDFTYALVVLFNTCFCCIYVFAGVAMEKTLYLVISIAAFLLVMIYSSIDYGIKAARHDMNTNLNFKLARLILIIIGFVASTVLSLFVIRDFDRYAFDMLRMASTSHVQMYKRLVAFTCLLVIDLQVMVSLLILTLAHGASLYNPQLWPELVTLAVGLPLAICWMLFGYTVARREIRPLMIGFEIFGVVILGYLCWKIYVLDQNGCPDVKHVTTSSTTPTSTSMTMPYYCFSSTQFWVTNIITDLIFGFVHICTLLTGIVVYKGFGNGLKESLMNRDKTFLDGICSRTTSPHSEE